MLETFPSNTITVTYKRGKNLRELISPSLFPRVHNQHSSSSEKCQKRCDNCTNFLVASTEFTCFATKRKYKVKGILKCTSKNVIYLISCKCCGKQYIGSAIGFKERFSIHKSDINTGKVRCGVANHLLNVCHSEGNKFEYLQVQLIEQVSVNNSKNIDKMLREREKYWQAQLFRLMHGLNSPNEWYAQNRRGYGKYFTIECIRAWNSYHVETSLRISLCLLYGGFLSDINSCCGNSKQTTITPLFDLYTELIM